jgi:hypothetical protein
MVVGIDVIMNFLIYSKSLVFIQKLIGWLALLL